MRGGGLSNQNPPFIKGVFLGVPVMRVLYHRLFGFHTISCNRTKRRRTMKLTRRVRMRRARQPEAETSKTRGKRTGFRV